MGPCSGTGRVTRTGAATTGTSGSGVGRTSLNGATMSFDTGALETVLSTSVASDGPTLPTCALATLVRTESRAAVAAIPRLSGHGIATMLIAPAPMSAARVCANVLTARSPVACQNARVLIVRLPKLLELRVG